MQIKKAEIAKIFEKLKLDVRSTKHRYGWFTYDGRKIIDWGKSIYTLDSSFNKHLIGMKAQPVRPEDISGARLGPFGGSM